ncbi:hypothetical protein [Actinokineospora sp. HUAS TT18]|uniref:hypothetical protein n=1 Tax=Actinokineospora sp. HUAS TT18 TaxID=3447451 RepID=UPI003F521D9B
MSMPIIHTVGELLDVLRGLDRDAPVRWTESFTERHLAAVVPASSGIVWLIAGESTGDLNYAALDEIDAHYEANGWGEPT